MSHDHPGHTHQNSRSADRRALAIVLGLVVVYMVAELTGGILTNSLALIADAGHMLSDAAALAQLVRNMGCTASLRPETHLRLLPRGDSCGACKWSNLDRTLRLYLF